MAVQEIRLLGNPVLRADCDTVKDFSSSATSRTVTDLFDTLGDFRMKHGFGRGIAAPQIGVKRRIVAITLDEPLALLNPRIVKRSKQMMTLWDDCFSFPDIVVKVRRHAKITVEYRDGKGQPHRVEAVGGLSELLQHEIDHLDGILAIDRAIDTTHIFLRSELDKLSAYEHSTIPL